eukprot:751004-Hanusia_phi.AAC.4
MSSTHRLATLVLPPSLPLAISAWRIFFGQRSLYLIAPNGQRTSKDRVPRPDQSPAMAGRGAVTVPVPSRRWGLSMGLTCESFPSSSHQHHLHAAHTSISSLSSHSGFSDAALRCAKIPPDCVDCVGNAWRDLCGRERNLQGGMSSLLECLCCAKQQARPPPLVCVLSVILAADDSDLDEEDIRGWISEFLLSENDVTNFKSLCQEAPNTLQLRRVLNFYWKKSSKVSDMLEVIGSRKLGQIKREERSALQSRIRRELEEFKKEEETIHQSWEECKLIGAPNAQSEQENKRIVKEAEQSKRITGLNLLEVYMP